MLVISDIGSRVESFTNTKQGERIKDINIVHKIKRKVLTMKPNKRNSNNTYIPAQITEFTHLLHSFLFTSVDVVFF
jgi:hypothetical protein